MLIRPPHRVPSSNQASDASPKVTYEVSRGTGKSHLFLVCIISVNNYVAILDISRFPKSIPCKEDHNCCENIFVDPKTS